MKLCLNKDGIKRYIETPFVMAIDRGDLFRLSRHLAAAAAGMESEGMSYAWISVNPDLDVGPPNTPVKEWSE